MKITFTDEYKSLGSFESEELSDFLVITGKNGSGKSQLLELIIARSAPNSRYKDSVIITPDVVRIQKDGLLKLTGGNVKANEDWLRYVNGKWQNFSKLQSEANIKLYEFFEKKAQLNNLSIDRHELFSTSDDYREIIARHLNGKIGSRRITIDAVDVEAEKLAVHFLLLHKQLFSFAREVSLYCRKSLLHLTANDFLGFPFSESIENGDLFTSSLEVAFYDYAKRRSINANDWFEKREYGYDNGSVSDKEFVEKYQPPWIVINNIFNRHTLDFYFKEIDRRDFNKDAPTNVFLCKKSTNKVIATNELSTGEKIITGLILKLFASEFYSEQLKFPDLILLDEPDAFLHPEMSQLLMEILQETFVQKLGIKVIMTTHSPSTVALSPENSIYQLSNGEKTSLKKVTKDEALKVLTGFIPTLSIDYKNHKQVFVESPTDVIYYQNIHDKHQQCNKLQSKIYFIANTAGKGNCTEVYNIVNAIRKSGNTTSYGFVDWDLKNQPNEHVIVHGYGERYSVESFILDPIYIICLLMSMNNAHKICDVIGVDMTYNQFSLGQESDERLQEITKCFFKEIENRYPDKKYELDRRVVEYYNSSKIEYPKWYLEMKSHDLVTLIKIVFPALGKKYTSEGHLQKDLSIVSAKFYPFVPLTTIKTIESIP